MATVHWIGINMLYANPLLQKNIQSDMNSIKKDLIAEGSSGSNG